jgi:predicted nucleic acid-binding protein
MRVVDTTLLIGHARGDSAVETYLTDHATETLIVPTIAFQELAVGEVAARDKTKEATLGYLGAFDVRAFDSDHAYHAAVIEADLRAKGEYDPTLASDILIGGVARSLSLPVVTRNTDHFSKFNGVSVETY